MGKPLAIYREFWINYSRRWELYDDRIVVVGKSMSMDFESTLALSDLGPRPDTLRIRHWSFRLAIMMLLGSFLTLFAMAVAHGSAPEREQLTWALGSISFSLAFTASIIFCYTFRKVKFLRFNSHAGSPLLDVGCSGPDRKRFDMFTEKFIERITAIQKAGLVGVHDEPGISGTAD